MEICLITGTSTGIGHATALHLARLGYKVYASMRNAAKAGPLRERAAAENLPLVIETLDVSDNQSMLSCVQRIIAAEGRIDVLVNNAGLSSSSPIETYPEDEHRAMFEANYWGPVKLTQAVLPSMCAHGRGAIVNISSLVGRLAWANQGAYCASKFAVIGFTQSLAHELAEHKINVNAVCPGTTLTERTGYIAAALNEQDAPTQDATQTMVGSLAEQTPLGRVAEPEDVARTVAFLASAESDYTTGVALLVAGGIQM